ncbi:MAG TPA: ribokinase [Rhodobacteraceae bacterium]|jgi:ribokinase|nr:ribokinase [Paracoccaceae bacterium]HBV54302.1 ribokinase [Paracoccaceae bacterium]
MPAIWSFGSINIDHAYRVDHIPAPGETIAAREYSADLGGKGANQSVAAARAGASVSHIGQIGADGKWAKTRLSDYGVNTRFITETDTPTGHAIITIDAYGENAITIFPGANHSFKKSNLEEALSGAAPTDFLLLQNETNLQVEAAALGHQKGLYVIYSAAPFDAEATKAVLPYLSMIILNEIEAHQLHQSQAKIPASVTVVTTRGANGAVWQSNTQSFDTPAFIVEPVDTTGAGDTFTGYLAASLAAGLSPEAAMIMASRAAALKVTRFGTASAIPSRAEVDVFPN